MTIILKRVKPFSKSGHIIVPKKYVGRLAKIILEDEEVGNPDLKKTKGDDYGDCR
ncbi:DUF2080 family transposase-associated protein [Methanocaldococcus sp. 10A]